MTTGDMVLVFSTLFFVVMCLIPLWGPRVFFRDRDTPSERHRLQTDITVELRRRNAASDVKREQDGYNRLAKEIASEMRGMEK